MSTSKENAIIPSIVFIAKRNSGISYSKHTMNKYTIINTLLNNNFEAHHDDTLFSSSLNLEKIPQHQDDTSSCSPPPLEKISLQEVTAMPASEKQ